MTGMSPHARLLRVLRDRGAQSKAELGDLVELSRSKIAAELDRLTELGLVEEAGLAESRGGRVPSAPPIMPGWDQYPVRDTLMRELGCPVLVDNDVNVMALGEKQSGVAKNSDDFLFVKIGTGVGCGILVGGEVYRGANGSAGDIGHIQVDEDGPPCSCGNLGCLEAFFSGGALARSAQAVARSGESPFLAIRLEEQGMLAAT